MKQSTSKDERSALSMLPAGKLSVRLIGGEPFDPAQRIGQRVVAKGALMGDEHGIRLNLTSLQTVDGNCGQ